MTVCLATPADAAVVAHLLIAFNTEFDAPVPTRADLERRFRLLLARPEVLVLLGGERDAPRGFALATLRPSPYYDGPLAVLDELYVAPAHRGRGLGGRLVRSLEHELRARGCGELPINVDEVDDGARRFYTAHGFLNLEPGTTSRMLCCLKEL